MSTGEDFVVHSSEVGPPDCPNPCLVRIPESPPDHELTTEAKRTYTRPIARPKHNLTVPGGWIYWLSWGSISAGDCTMDDATVYLYPDGQIFFQAYTLTSSSGDVWIVRGITFTDSDGNQVGQPVGQHDGMNMAWEDNWYPFAFWDAIPGVDPEAAAQIRGASITNHC